jgi:hypothetical protein
VARAGSAGRGQTLDGASAVGEGAGAGQAKAPAEMPGLFGAGIAGDAEQHRGIITRQAYRTGEKAAGISSLFSCRMGRTPVWGGHWPPGLRDASRTRARSLRSLYTQVWTNVFSPPSSLVQQAAKGENCSRASMALPHLWSAKLSLPHPRLRLLEAL